MNNFQLLRRAPRTRTRPAGTRAVGVPPAPDQRAAVQEALGHPVQAQLKLGSPDDAHERQADAVAEQVVAAPSDRLQRQCSDCAQGDKPGTPPVEAERQDETLQRKKSKGGEATLAGSQAAAIAQSQGGGQALPATEQHFFGSRMGADFSGVRVHQDAQAGALSSSLSARAFTVGRDLYFGPGEYQPGSTDGRRLIAHELTHVLQQRHGDGGTLRRVVELRPPGKGEASAFDRAGDLIARLNSLSQGLVYTLDGRVLRCEAVDEGKLSVFDREMKALIERDEVIPMRLINQSGRTEGSPGSGYEPVVQDTWTRAYVDLDDLLASDPLGFKTQMMHILTERAETKNYAQRIGSPNLTVKEYDRAHGLAYKAEERVLRDEIGDDTITFRSAYEQPNNTWVVQFGSKEGYFIFKVFRHFDRELVPAETFARERKGKRMTIDALIASRQQKAPPPTLPPAVAP
ncbi:MAG TPA: DUF4157 domain-containing protein [Ideonella sp.]|uniref:eCIS core domain-containing protein n=1 Tax=Ideonella sp. TaxID=1929293 RepID=UPI002BEE4037|nr:DUF4157 domain-containing protein [Ideonella sp.]HSI51428.1 DUF4157 domain-containing protein [Ideonella sp.]